MRSSLEDSSSRHDEHNALCSSMKGQSFVTSGNTGASATNTMADPFLSCDTGGSGRHDEHHLMNTNLLFISSCLAIHLQMGGQSFATSGNLQSQRDEAKK